MSGIVDKIIDIKFFENGQNEDLFVGRPYYIDYSKANVLISDYWKYKVKGISQGSFLLAFYDNPFDLEIHEALLLRVIQPAPLPTDSNVIASMVEYYKDNLNTSGKKSDLDDFTKYEFSFSGLECRILGTFYKEGNNFEFGADVENFYSAHNYKVFKATGKVLEKIVNQRDRDILVGNESEFPIGKVRYSSSRRFTSLDTSVNSIQVYINPGDILGKRTALFGMTRTGKSNTVKKIIQATVEISTKAKNSGLPKAIGESEKFFEPIDKESGAPMFPVGQIIFDINGEYANANLQDKGTAIFDLYKEKVIRYSVLEKSDFQVLKVNFYKEVEIGFSLIVGYFKSLGNQVDYMNDFLSINLEKPDDYETDWDVKTGYDRKKAAYLCCLYRAGFPINKTATVQFQGSAEINENIHFTTTDEFGNQTTKKLEPDVRKRQFLNFEEASTWFYQVWKYYDKWEYLVNYEKKNGREWADSELKALLRFLSKYKFPNEKTSITGRDKLKPLIKYHTDKAKSPFEIDIIKHLREGKIVIVDLSQGDPDIKNYYSERICSSLFNDSMERFIRNAPNNFLQFYFEEAHNLFPKKDDKDLSQIYNRIAKEGAKLHLGMIYATQEVSSISSNILKNTQNWFISHLNNEDETKELKKYYDFGDFTEALIKFSAKSDKGFVRMKTYSNPFIVPVQIDQFLASKS
jgi:DNA helicase HerA-like ATPase